MRNYKGVNNHFYLDCKNVLVAIFASHLRLNS